MDSPDLDLAGALAQHTITLHPEQIQRLEAYCRLLWEWNTKLNLTRHTDYEKFVGRDLVDSLAFSEHLQPGQTVRDVGSGGGVPGVVLAILRPDLAVSLCESVAKRARALADIVERLEINVPVYHARVEELLGTWTGDVLTFRAVARLPKLLGWLQGHWDSFDLALIMQGQAWVKERAESRHLGLMNDLALRKLTSYPMLGTNSQSVLLRIQPKERETS